MIATLRLAAAVEYISLRCRAESWKVAVRIVVKKYRRLGGHDFRISERSLLRWVSTMNGIKRSVEKSSSVGSKLAVHRRRRWQ